MKITDKMRLDFVLRGIRTNNFRLQFMYGFIGGNWTHNQTASRWYKSGRKALDAAIKAERRFL